MLLEVATFRDRVRFGLDALVNELQSETHRRTPEEAVAWRNSLPAFSDVLGHTALERFHIQLGGPGSLAVEYRLPASSSWADLVLLGRRDDRAAAVIVELKDWRTDGDQPGPREGLIIHARCERHHPSDQVRGYVEYCRRFHDVVQKENADVSGCVFFTFASTVDCYAAEPHHELAAAYPLFARNANDVTKRFPEHLAAKLGAPDPDFASRFSRGIYRQDRGFVRQIASAITGKESSPFVLLDQQRVGFETCMKHVERVLKPARTSAKTRRAAKSVVIVEGPPGSGKSVVAAHLWAQLAADERIDGNVVLTTTSSSQRSNWEQLFERAARDRTARGVVVGANRYNPGLSPIWVKQQRELGKRVELDTWRDNLELFRSESRQSRCPDDSFAVSIVDEAHGLIDPTVPGKEGVAPSGWAMHAGPQAWHVIRSSRVSVFLMDGEQSYRDNETTSRESIERFAKDFGVDEVQTISLAGAQFRCGGSVEYMRWLDSLLALSPKREHAKPWRKGHGGQFDFEIVSDPYELETALRARLAEGHTVRLLASYARPWKTKDAARPHSVNDASKDFHITCDVAGVERTWSKVWNYAPKQDYALFVQAPPGCCMAADPLAEVGCPYVVRGFDFDVIGVLWLSDLVRRGDRWVANHAHVHESAWKKTRAQARNEKRPGPASAELVRRLQRGYRILLSRAIRGAYVWFEDEETRDYVQRTLTP